MFCQSCGTQLPDEANFCWKCGKPQKEGVRSEEPQYEICEILVGHIKDPLFGQPTLNFWADAVGPKGSYNAGASPQFKGIAYEASGHDKATLNAHKALVRELGQDGWEPTGRGDYWYNLKFRRRIK